MCCSDQDEENLKKPQDENSGEKEIGDYCDGKNNDFHKKIAADCEIKYHFLLQIANALELSIETFFRESPSFIESQPHSSESDDAKELVKIYLCLNHSNKSAIIRFARLLSESETG